MNNVRNADYLKEITTRIDGLSAQSTRQWSTMTPAQMLWHCSQQLNLGTGDMKVKDMFPAPMRWLLKWAFAKVLPFGKGMGTIPGIEAHQKNDLNFDAEKAELKTKLAQFAALPESAIAKDHPIFGNMTSDDWGQIVYKHLDHHLRQFGA